MKQNRIGETASFFNRFAEYHSLINSLDTYVGHSQALQGEVRGRVLDVGNGGVVNYETTQVVELVAIDIAEDLTRSNENSCSGFPLVFKPGEASALPVGDREFDTVVMQMLIHHLAGDSFRETRKETLKAFQEAHRVLKTDGRLVIIESTFPRFFVLLERSLYAAMKWLLALLGHPLVYQWHSQDLAVLLREAGFQKVSVTMLPMGRWIVFLGRLWPSILSPARSCKIIAEK